MLEEPLTLYKLIVLYMLDGVSFPMTKAQIADFIQEKGYTDFFTLQQAISDLVEANLVTSQTVRNRTKLFITKDGRETLHFFENRISDGIKQDVREYFAEKEFSMRNEIAVQGDYYKSVSGEYEAHLTARERDITLVDITLSVPVEKTAASICDNWQKKNQDIYQFLVRELF